MSDDEPLRVVLRSRFLRWAVGFQLLWLLFAGVGATVHIVQGDLQIEPNGITVFVAGSTTLAVLALIIAALRRNSGAAELTPHGIRPYPIIGRWNWWVRWSGIVAVKVKAGIVGNRWLEVWPENGPRFVLTARPVDPVGVLDALERFAGPDHPLTLAMAQVVDS